MGWLGAASIAMIAVGASILLWPERGVALLRAPTNEEGYPQWVLNLIVDAVAFPIMLVAGLAAVISLFVRFRRARGDERQQIKWFAYAAALTLFWTFLIEGIPNTSRTFEAVIGRAVACSSSPRSPSPPGSPSSATVSTT